MELLDRPRVLDDSVHDCIRAALLDRPANERDGEEIEGVWPAEAKGALPLAVVGEIEAWRATDDENKSALGESGAKSPEMGRVVAEKAPHVEAGTLARRDPALRSIAVPVSCSGSCKIWAELNEPRTVDSAEESVLSEVFNKCVIRSAKAVKKRQEDNMSLRDGKASLA